jgi:hypothetical protein
MATAGVVRRRAHSTDRTGTEDPEARGREEAAVTKRPRPASLVRTMSVSVDAALAGEIFDHFCNAGTLKSILRSYRFRPFLCAYCPLCGLLCLASWFTFIGANS